MLRVAGRRSAATLVTNGFEDARDNKFSFYRENRDIRVVVRGVDFVVTGKRGQFKWFEEVVRSKYPLTMRGVLRPEPEDVKEFVILNRKMH